MAIAMSVSKKRICEPPQRGMRSAPKLPDLANGHLLIASYMYNGTHASAFFEYYLLT
jgi:hypothetical protein